MKILYYHCFSGICGDMHLGAMIDLGVKKDYLISELSRLKLKGYTISVSKDKRKGITGTKVDVLPDDQKKNFNNEHRNLEDIIKIISSSDLSNDVKTHSLDMFNLLAEAEAKIHGVPKNKVHFHEVGAIDSIIDIVGAAICIDYFKPDKIMSSTVELGGGFIKCSHGTLPVPAPATVEILKDCPVKSGLVPFETTTPTGAVILASNVDKFTDNTEFVINKTGYGIGHRDTEIPNILRVYLAEASDPDSIKLSECCMIECNIDDMNPELYDYVINRLFENGADDVFITSIIMKKNRPAVKLSVLCKNNIIEKISGILFSETTTIGLRSYNVNKGALDRKIVEIETRFGKVKIKQAFYQGKMIKNKPESADCQKIARQNKIPVKDVYDEIYYQLKKSDLGNAKG